MRPLAPQACVFLVITVPHNQQVQIKSRVPKELTCPSMEALVYQIVQFVLLEGIVHRHLLIQPSVRKDFTVLLALAIHFLVLLEPSATLQV